MMDEAILKDNAKDTATNAAQKQKREALLPGNREVITDLYVSKNIENEPKDYAFKVYVRLNARKQTLKKVNFEHCVFEGCYFNSCVFDSCNFIGCRFIACNFHLSAFSGCKFGYATFERCQIDDEILEQEAPSEENLRMRFARSLRVNFQQIGDAKAANKAISVELKATAIYLKKSWSSKESYFRKKYPGWKKVSQFFKWLEFRVLDSIWGNGESPLKLLRAVLVVHLLIAAYSTLRFGNIWDLKSYLASLAASPGVFFGLSTSHPFPTLVLSLIASIRLVSFAFLTAILVKRFGRR